MIGHPQHEKPTTQDRPGLARRSDGSKLHPQSVTFKSECLRMKSHVNNGRTLCPPLSCQPQAHTDPFLPGKLCLRRKVTCCQINTGRQGRTNQILSGNKKYSIGMPSASGYERRETTPASSVVNARFLQAARAAVCSPTKGNRCCQFGLVNMVKARPQQQLRRSYAPPCEHSAYMSNTDGNVTKSGLCPRKVLTTPRGSSAAFSSRYTLQRCNVSCQDINAQRRIAFASADRHWGDKEMQSSAQSQSTARLRL